MSAEASTPLMRQYNGIKQQVPNALLMFRLGDFYELFFEDAVTAARELEITLTARNKEKGQAIPMCGVPYHAAEGYIARLIQKGYRVAICDQMEDAARRARSWSSARSRASSRPAPRWTRTCCARTRTTTWLRWRAMARAPAWRTWMSPPASSASPRSTPPKSPAALETSGRARGAVPGGLPLLTSKPRHALLRTELEDWIFSYDYADRSLRDHFQLLSLDGCGLAGPSAAVGAAGAILHYLRDTQRAALDHLDRPTFYDRADAHGARRRHRAQSGTGRAALRRRERRNRRCSACSIRPAPAWAGACCASGCCGLRWIAPRSKRGWMPSANCCEQTILRAELRKQLGGILDLERLLAKVTLGSRRPARSAGARPIARRDPAAASSCFETQQSATPARHLRRASTKSPKCAT